MELTEVSFSVRKQRLQSRANQCGTCDGQIHTGTGFLSEYFDIPPPESYNHCTITFVLILFLPERQTGETSGHSSKTVLLYDMIWYDMVCYDMIYIIGYGTMRYDMIYNMIW